MKKPLLTLLVLFLVFLPIVSRDVPPSLVGTLVNRQSGEPVACLIVWACEVYRDPAGDIYICDTARSPSAFSGLDGKFNINRISYKEYVLVATKGEFLSYDIIEGDNWRPAVWNVTRSASVDTGEIKTWLDSMPCGSLVVTPGILEVPIGR